jgi:hypothetical protein
MIKQLQPLYNGRYSEQKDLQFALAVAYRWVPPERSDLQPMLGLLKRKLVVLALCETPLRWVFDL